MTELVFALSPACSETRSQTPGDSVYAKLNSRRDRRPAPQSATSLGVGSPDLREDLKMSEAEARLQAWLENPPTRQADARERAQHALRLWLSLQAAHDDARTWKRLRTPVASVSDAGSVFLVWELRDRLHVELEVGADEVAEWLVVDFRAGSHVYHECELWEPLPPRPVLEALALFTS